MTKEEIGKEIKELIRSIKTHYTFVEEEDRIPMIELELITSKIRRLYEKSIVYNYLYASDEENMKHERLVKRITPVPPFEKNSPNSFVQPVILNSIPEPFVESVVVEKAAPIAEPISAAAQPIIAEIPIDDADAKPLKDLKLLIGINDKFLLINNLFARNDVDYKSAVEHLNTIRSKALAMEYMNSLARQNNWNTESYAFVRFVKIVEKRFK